MDTLMPANIQWMTRETAFRNYFCNLQLYYRHLIILFLFCTLPVLKDYNVGSAKLDDSEKLTIHRHGNNAKLDNRQRREVLIAHLRVCAKLSTQITNLYTSSLYVT